MTSSGRSRRRAALLCVVLALVPFLLFWRVWWPDPSWRDVFAYGDFAEQHYPLRTLVAQELRAGRILLRRLWPPLVTTGRTAP